ncbi:MAG TPA: hypothetical protein VMC41_04350 [Candidatus Nanoarchaeia archaeon]|nr:hypothetical protein [Candidatus Nanoarchaeia archaeon]
MPTTVVEQIGELVGEKLDGFSIQELTEVYRVDEDGRKTTSIGFFKNGNIAAAFAQNQTDSCFHRYKKEFVLTDGKVGFLFVGEPVKLLNDEQEALKVREAALEKLSPAERALLQI